MKTTAQSIKRVTNSCVNQLLLISKLWRNRVIDSLLNPSMVHGKDYTTRIASVYCKKNKIFTFIPHKKYRTVI